MNAALQGTIAENNQRCDVRSLYFIWLAYVVGLIVFAFLGKWIGLLVWAGAVPLGKWLQIRYYRYLSECFGYGRFEKDRQPTSMRKSAAVVTYYRAIGCPFCPVVGDRLEALKKQMGFDLKVVDVTMQPQLLAQLAIRSVPVVDVGGRRLVGNVTSEQLAELIAPEPVGAAV